MIISCTSHQCQSSSCFGSVRIKNVSNFHFGWNFFPLSLSSTFCWVLSFMTHVEKSIRENRKGLRAEISESQLCNVCQIEFPTQCLISCHVRMGMENDITKTPPKPFKCIEYTSNKFRTTCKTTWFTLFRQWHLNVFTLYQFKRYTYRNFHVDVVSLND